jgi:hypothetical protein
MGLYSIYGSIYGSIHGFYTWVLYMGLHIGSIDGPIVSFLVL